MPRFQRHQQRELFAEPPAVLGVQLPPELQEQLRQALAQWIRTLVSPVREGDGNGE